MLTSGTTGQSAVSWNMVSGTASATDAASRTYYYHADQIGSARLMSSGGGWPVWQGIFTPFGQEVSPQITSGHYKFSGKERDTESDLDYFGARYYGSSMGRFTSPDPVIITAERLQNPQQLNLYAYVANNPLRFIDPNGEVLTATGNQQADYNDLCKILGDACAGRLAIDSKTGDVTFNPGALDDKTPAMDLSKNEGAKLINDLVTSKNNYEFSEGPTVMTSTGSVKIDMVIANLPSFKDQPNGGQPRAGVADVVALNFNNKNITLISNTKLGVAQQYTVAFHELAEAYAKIDGGKASSYAEGHNAALAREQILRDQRPYLKQYNTGAGGPANSPNPEGGIVIKK
jgi:RHS repeat-associated protein